MQKILISVPDELVLRLRVTIPSKQRSKVICCLIAREVEQREKDLYACALEVEKDVLLNEEIKEWDVTLSDGLGEL